MEGVALIFGLNNRVVVMDKIYDRGIKFTYTSDRKLK